MTNNAKPKAIGQLAKACGEELALRVCKSYAGFYIGTRAPDGAPFTRESVEYWPTRDKAETAQKSGTWTQRRHL